MQKNSKKLFCLYFIRLIYTAFKSTFAILLLLAYGFQLLLFASH